MSNKKKYLDIKYELLEGVITLLLVVVFVTSPCQTLAKKNIKCQKQPSL